MLSSPHINLLKKSKDSLRLRKGGVNTFNEQQREANASPEAFTIRVELLLAWDQRRA